MAVAIRLLHEEALTLSVHFARIAHVCAFVRVARPRIWYRNPQWICPGQVRVQDRADSVCFPLSCALESSFCSLLLRLFFMSERESLFEGRSRRIVCVGVPEEKKKEEEEECYVAR